MMTRFLLPALAVGVLAGSANAEDPSTATAWTCTSQTSGHTEYVINGNELKKRDDGLERRYEACRRKHPAPTPGRDDKISADAILTDPCERLDLQSDTFQIVSNNRYGLIAVLPEMGEEEGSVLVAGRVIIIDKLTGHYVETLLSTPTPPLSPKAKKQRGARIAGNDYGGTCDVKALGNPNSVSSVPDVSQNLDAVVEDEKKPQTKRDTRETHVHAHRHHWHAHRHRHRHKH